MKMRLCLILLFLGLMNAPAAAPLSPGDVAVNYYLLCRELPINMAKINALRTTGAVAADQKLPRNILEARAGVLAAIGVNLATVQVLSQQGSGDRARVAVILSYYNNQPPRRLEIDLVKEDGIWKIAN